MPILRVTAIYAFNSHLLQAKNPLYHRLDELSLSISISSTTPSTDKKTSNDIISSSSSNNSPNAKIEALEVNKFVQFNSD